MSAVSKSRWLFLALSLLMTLVSFSAFAQRADGNIGGVAVAGDQILAVQDDTGFKRETVADEEGKYRFRSLPLGQYLVTITRDGNVVANVKVAVRPGTTTRIPDLKPNSQAAAAPAAAN